jgi:hypothetical protein
MTSPLLQNSPLAGQTESGTFSFDNAVVASDGTLHFAPGLFSALSFTWNGTTPIPAGQI